MVELRTMSPADAAAVWRLAQATPELDRYAPYAYLLLGTHFSGTCVVAEDAGAVVGVVTGYRPPADPGTLFVWQVAVAASHRRRGLARRLVRHLVARQAEPVERVQATVAPENAASRGLFAGLAAEWGAPLVVTPFLAGASMPAEAGPHPDEDLLTIGPIDSTCPPEPRPAP